MSLDLTAGLQAQLAHERRLRGEAETLLEAERATVAALREELEIRKTRDDEMASEGKDAEVDVIDAAGSGDLQIMASTRATATPPGNKRRAEDEDTAPQRKRFQGEQPSTSPTSEQKPQLLDPQELEPSGIVACKSCPRQLRWPEGVEACRCPCGKVLRLHQPPPAAAKVVVCGACSRQLRWPVGHDACRCPCGVVLQQPHQQQHQPPQQQVQQQVQQHVQHQPPPQQVQQQRQQQQQQVRSGGGGGGNNVEDHMNHNLMGAAQLGAVMRHQLLRGAQQLNVPNGGDQTGAKVDEVDYFVDESAKKRGHVGTRMLLVRWKGWGSEGDTWEAREKIMEDIGKPAVVFMENQMRLHREARVAESVARKADASSNAYKRSFPQRAARCEQGHALVSVTTTKELGCDKCLKLFAAGITLHGCKACDYDLCATCVKSQ